VSRRRRLADALIGTGIPFRNLARIDEYIRVFRKVTETTVGVRRPGATSRDLAYVACSPTDGFREMGLSPWDIAAGALLIFETGGLVSDSGGQERFLQRGDLVRGTPNAFAPLLAMIQEERKRG
jgi:myo-inositol-1(or 4)-monophosphatase